MGSREGPQLDELRETARDKGAASRPPRFALYLCDWLLLWAVSEWSRAVFEWLWAFVRFFLSLGVVAFAVMFGGRPMALRSGFVMLRRLGVGFLGHSSSPWFELRWLLNASTSSSFRFVGFSVMQRRKRLSRFARVALGTWRRLSEFWRGSAASGDNHARLGDRRSYRCVDSGRARFGIVAGAALAAAKIIFVIALLAFLVSAVVEVSRRGAP